MQFEAFAQLYPELPHNVSLYYSDTKRKFGLSHERAYSETVRYARGTGQAVGAEPGKPAHECKTFRLLKRSEV